MASELRTKMNELYPVRQWDINTVADGKLFTYSSVNTLANRDDFIADEFGKYQQQLNTEIANRTYKDTELAYKANAEIQARKNADQELLSKLAGEENAREATDTDINNTITRLNNELTAHAANRSETTYSPDRPDSHLTNASYTAFNEYLVNELTETNLTNWSSISALNGLTDNTITLTGSKFIDVTTTATDEITIGYKNPGTTPIGESDGVYLYNGEFLEASNPNSNKFGNTVVNFYCHDSTGNDDAIVSADSCTYINQSVVPIYASELLDIKQPKYVWGARYTTLISEAVRQGANNIVVYVRSGGKAAQEHILFNVEDLEKYKLYTVNVVPDCEIDKAAGNYNINLTFSANPDKFINYSNDNYAAYTYGYFYNVPQFGTYNGLYSGQYEGTVSLSANINNELKKVYVPLYNNRNVVDRTTGQYPFNDARYDTFLNDGGQYNESTGKVTESVAMYTIQPHTKKTMSINSDKTDIKYSLNNKTGTTDNAYGIGGHCTIKGKMMTLNETIDKHIVYRRQIAFMRGPDIDVQSSTAKQWYWQMFPSESAQGPTTMIISWASDAHKFIYAPGAPVKATTFDYDLMNFINTEGVMAEGTSETDAFTELQIRFKKFLNNSYYSEFWEKSDCNFEKNGSVYNLHLAKKDLIQHGYTIYFFSEATY